MKACHRKKKELLLLAHLVSVQQHLLLGLATRCQTRTHLLLPVLLYLLLELMPKV
jgi:hypothetical protein